MKKRKSTTEILLLPKETRETQKLFEADLGKVFELTRFTIVISKYSTEGSYESKHFEFYERWYNKGTTFVLCDVYNRYNAEPVFSKLLNGVAECGGEDLLLKILMGSQIKYIRVASKAAYGTPIPGIKFKRLQ